MAHAALNMAIVEPQMSIAIQRLVKQTAGVQNRLQFLNVQMDVVLDNAVQTVDIAAAQTNIVALVTVTLSVQILRHQVRHPTQFSTYISEHTKTLPMAL